MPSSSTQQILLSDLAGSSLSTSPHQQQFTNDILQAHLDHARRASASLIPQELLAEQNDVVISTAIPDEVLSIIFGAAVSDDERQQQQHGGAAAMASPSLSSSLTSSVRFLHAFLLRKHPRQQQEKQNDNSDAAAAASELVSEEDASLNLSLLQFTDVKTAFDDAATMGRPRSHRRARRTASSNSKTNSNSSHVLLPQSENCTDNDDASDDEGDDDLLIDSIPLFQLHHTNNQVNPTTRNKRSNNNNNNNNVAHHDDGAAQTTRNDDFDEDAILAHVYSKAVSKQQQPQQQSINSNNVSSAPLPPPLDPFQALVCSAIRTFGGPGSVVVIANKTARGQLARRQPAELARLACVDYASALRSTVDERRRTSEKRLVASFLRQQKIRDEALAQRRLAALRANDPEEYVRHLQTTKWSSLLEIMDKTHSLMESIGARLEQQVAADAATENISSSSSSTGGAGGVAAATTTTAATSLQNNNNGNSSSHSNHNNNNVVVSDAFRRFQAHVRSTKDEYKLVHKVPIFVEEQPTAVLATLMPHQLVGLRFLASLHGNGINGVLADDMGVGKTLQTLAFFAHLKETRAAKYVHLVIAPLSIVREWQDSINNFVPSLRVLLLSSEEDVLDLVAANNNNNKSSNNTTLPTQEPVVDVCLMALHRVRHISPGTLSKTMWHYVVVDEAHKSVSNPQTATCRAITSLPFLNRLVLTGTPLNSDVQELWALLQFINPGIFRAGSTQETFDDVFRKPFSTQALSNEIRLEPEERDLVVMRLHQILKPFVLRRTKLDIDATLQITFHSIWCPKSALQTELLKLLRERRVIPALAVAAPAADDRGGAGGGENNQTATSSSSSCYYQRVITVASQALQICNHPFMADFLPQLMRRDSVPDAEADEIALRSSGKLCVLDAILQHLRLQRRKIVVFSHFLDTIDLLENHFISRGWGEQFVSLTGMASPLERAEYVARFRDDSDTFIFLLSMKAGGCGLNLQSADTVLLYDRDYTATNEEQALARVFRMGQKNIVRAIYLMTRDATEERVATIARTKDKPRKEIIEGGQYLVKTEEEDEETASSSSSSSSDDDNDCCTSDDEDDNELKKDTRVAPDDAAPQATNDNQNDNKTSVNGTEEDIDCEDPTQVESVLREKVFGAFLKKSQLRNSKKETEEVEEKREEDEKNGEEDQEQHQALNDDDVPSNSNHASQDQKEADAANNTTIPHEVAASLPISHEEDKNGHSDSDDTETAEQDEQVTLPLHNHQHTVQIVSPYPMFEDLPLVLRNVFEECERNERDDNHGNGTLGRGCRQTTALEEALQEMDDEPEDFAVIEKIMEDEDLSDEDDALEIWRERTARKRNKLREAQEAARLAAEDGAHPTVSFSFSSSSLKAAVVGDVTDSSSSGRKQQQTNQKKLREDMKLKTINVKSKFTSVDQLLSMFPASK